MSLSKLVGNNRPREGSKRGEYFRLETDTPNKDKIRGLEKHLSRAHAALRQLAPVAQARGLAFESPCCKDGLACGEHGQPAHGRGRPVGSGTSRTTLWRRDKKFEESLADAGVMSSEEINALAEAHYLRNPHELHALLERLEEHTGILHAERVAIVDAIQREWGVAFASALMHLGCRSRAKYGLVRHLLSFRLTDDGLRWERKKIQIGDEHDEAKELDIYFPALPHENTVDKHDRIKFQLMMPEVSEDQLFVVVNVDRATRLCLDSSEAFDHSALRRTLALGGDAGGIAYKTSAVGVSIRDVTYGTVGTQRAKSMVDLWYGIGNDGYENLSGPEAMKMWRGLRAVANMKGDGAFTLDPNPKVGRDASLVVQLLFELSADWKFLRAINGQHPHPLSKCPCPFCYVERKEMHLRPQERSAHSSKRRTYKEMAQLAHAVLDGEDFVPFKCPGCKKQFNSADELGPPRDQLTKEQLDAHHETHFSQEYHQPPLVHGIVPESSQYNDLLHFLLNSHTYNFNGAVRRPAEKNKGKVKRCNAEMKLRHLTFPKLICRDPKDKKETHTVEGVIGAACLQWSDEELQKAFLDISFEGIEGSAAAAQGGLSRAKWEVVLRDHSDLLAVLFAPPPPCTCEARRWASLMHCQSLIGTCSYLTYIQFCNIL